MSRRPGEPTGVRGAAPVPARIAAAIAALDLDPGDRLLEIGCGRGVAAAQIAPRLARGHLTALDRSAVAITAARARNAAHVAAGTVTFLDVALRDARLPPGAFTKAFAIDVNLFWLSGRAELAVVAAALSRGGRLHLVHQAPSRTRLPRIVDGLRRELTAAGFAIDDVDSPDDADVPLVMVTARPPDQRRVRSESVHHDLPDGAPALDQPVRLPDGRGIDR